VPKGVKSIDVFCVGGGGSGWEGHGPNASSNQPSGGGGGGYTATKSGISVTPGQSIAVTIAPGGKADSWSSTNYGGDTSVGSFCTAKGGGAGSNGYGNGTSCYYVCYYPSAYIYSTAIMGGSGGSGGCGMVLSNAGSTPYLVSYTIFTGYGGKDGGDGYIRCTSTPYDYYQYYGRDNLYHAIYYSGLRYCKGQGTTTRYFGESNGTLYSTGGDGYNYSGGSYSTPSAGTGNGASSGVKYGGSGVAIIRWGK
jgi:hypothetical protein